MFLFIFLVLDYNSAQATYLFMNKSAGELRNEVKSLSDPDDEKMKEYFQNTLEQCEKILKSHDEKLEEFKSIVASYGENDVNNIGEFFVNWNKFTSSLRAAIKYNHAARKKEEAKKKEQEKLENRKKKLKAKALELKKAKQQEEAKKIEKGEKVSASPSSSRRNLSDSAFDSVMDDLLGDGGDVLGVGALSAGLKSGNAFAALRGKRKHETPPTISKNPSPSSSDSKKSNDESGAVSSPGGLKRDISKMSQIQRKRKQRKERNQSPIDVTW